MKQQFLISISLTLLALPFVGCEKKVTTEDLSNVLGENIRGQEIQTILSSLGEKPEIKRFKEIPKSPYKENFYYLYEDKGISLRFDDMGNLSAIFLYSEGADGYRQYQGKLPKGLAFQDIRKDIEEKLGSPEKSGGGGVIRFWSQYPNIGIGIGYVSKSTSDMLNRIHHISLSKPKITDDHLRELGLIK
jgi:hypothetical protein